MKPPKQKRWVVRSGDGSTVAAILGRAGEDVRAVREGRVFVGRVRVSDAAYRVRVGDEVKIGATSPPRAQVVVVWERDGLLACNKPAGIPTVADHVGASHALLTLAAAHAGRSAESMFVTSRLDREVSGVVVFATTSEAEARLRTAREEGRYVRRYVALARDTLMKPESRDASGEAFGVWDAPIGEGKDPRHRAAYGPSAKLAVTRWAVVARAGGFAMLAVAPQTGRTHQIRVHASHAGAPLFGDRDYGGATRITLENGRIVALSRIALHAARVTVPGAGANEASLVAEAPIPPELLQLWEDLGGAPEAWNTAVTCVFDA